MKGGFICPTGDEQTDLQPYTRLLNELGATIRDHE